MYILRYGLSLSFCLCLMLGGCSDNKHAQGGDEKDQGSLHPPIDEPAEPGSPKFPPNIIWIISDDQGFADLSIQQQVTDVRTPNIDKIARNGFIATQAYTSAPQCTPARAGLLTGRYQQRFGTDDTSYLPMPRTEITIAEHLRDAGYATGFVGKWHLDISRGSKAYFLEHYQDPNYSIDKVPATELESYYPENRGFDDVFVGLGNDYRANFDLDGNDRELSMMRVKDYRINAKNSAARAFIRRHHDEPFFLVLSYLAPHVPLAALPMYLNRFPEDMPVRRRHALAMLSAIDDGVGSIISLLHQHNIYDNTLVVFLSDNGAPLMLNMPDDPDLRKEPAWDGSLNFPWAGEKGMLADGGIRIPLVGQWPAQIAAGSVVDEPIILMDVTQTTLTAAVGAENDSMDGVDLLKVLSGDEDVSQRPLFWRFWGQSSVRKGKWKYLESNGVGKYLFDMSSNNPEANNLAGDNPEVVESLRRELQGWMDSLHTTGNSTESYIKQEKVWYQHYYPEPFSD